jgi:WhiB family redox-sensing transcriptional regulator
VNTGLPFEEVPPPGPWRARGACAAVPTEVFFPGRGASLEAAKGVCRACPVIDACRAYAIPLAELKGVWGGLGEVERRRLRAQGAEAPPPATRAPRRRGAPARPGNGALYRTLVVLSASPGRWARVARFADAHAAAGMAVRLRSGWVSAPAGRWAFEARAADGGSALYACYEPVATTASSEVAS